ncbi:MAG: GGDEF domain-containing protein [Paracoccaceae bacterium]|nr:GGDEF domain-containing protein [Paracoccaceae bacterium]
MSDYKFGFLTWLHGTEEHAHTHPLTLLCLGLGLLATWSQLPLRRATRFEATCWYVVILVALAAPALSDVVNDLFPHAFLGQQGWNTSAGLVLMALGQLMRSRLPNIAFAAAIGAVFVSFVAINGYLIGHQKFFGHMSLTSAFGLLGLAIANLIRFSRRRALRMILRDSPVARVVRMQIKVWLAICLITPMGLRFFTEDLQQSYALLHSLEMLFFLASIIYFGLRFGHLFEAARRTQRMLLTDMNEDHLTGAATRRAAVDHFLNWSQRQQLGVILVDLDRFKDVNDRFGHEAGDRILSLAAKALKGELRTRDMLARWGGEEFLILMPVPDPTTLRQRAEQLRHALATVQDPAGR